MIDADAEAEKPSRVNHSSAGALRAMTDLGARGIFLALVIAGHHAGLADVEDLVTRRLTDDERKHLAAAVEGGADADWLRLRETLPFPAGLSDQEPRAVELWVRFLFSALIDGDRLDTERFHDAQKTRMRGSDVPMLELAARLDGYVDDLAARARTRSGPSRVNDVRAEVLRDCRQRAAEPQGIFSLTVPTGGGKTLASLSFALRHAAAHQLDGVIVVIPYTSIIEQNAAVLKTILGDEQVLEHHTNFDPGDQRKYWLDVENWDVPVVVTTSVQFFESLFANKTSAVRKVHSIARSVIVFDEVQTLPPSLLLPIVDVMCELAGRYHSSLVLCTATQPALQKRPAFPCGFAEMREIVREPQKHFQALQRVDAHWPRDLHTPEPWPDLAARIAAQPSALAIVHRRNDARLLCELLPEDTLHLSAAMCPQHRTSVLNEVRRRLNDGAACRLIATQLVEAGVDLDFPIVFRALGGLDSLAQAAGRCNREGRLDRGALEIFVAETAPPPGELRQALDAARVIASKHGGRPDLFGDPSLFTEYFRQFYGSPTDSKSIQTDRAGLRFATVGRNFRIIDEGQESVVIPLDAECRTILHQLRTRAGIPRLLRRRLQRYSVSIRTGQMIAMQQIGAAVETEEGSGIWVLAEIFSSMYHQQFGLLQPSGFTPKPESLIT